MADVVAIKGGTATARVLSGSSMVTRGTTLETAMAESPAISSEIDGHYQAIAAYQAAQSGIYAQFKTFAEKILVKQVDLDANLPRKDLVSALTELIRQMTANSTSINASSVAIGSQTDQGTPVGNPIFVASVKNAKGFILQTAFAETLRVTITGDSQASSTARQEPYSVLGAGAVADPFSHLWPAGSGASYSGTLVDAQLDNSSGNKLTNGDFETFSTTNYPDNWSIVVGAAGTDIFAGGSSDAYTQSNCLKITGDGSTLPSITQELNKAASTSAGSGGTPGKLLPLTQYAVHGKIKGSDTPSTGVLTVDLIDGSGTVIADAAGTNNSFTVGLTALTTSYVSFSGVFRTPASLPTTIKLRIRTTTAIEDTIDVFIDDVALAEMAPLYNGGPFMVGFAGATKVLTGDTWTFATTNTMGVMAAWMEKVFGMRDKGLQIPYAGSPTVADSLVT